MRVIADLDGPWYVGADEALLLVYGLSAFLVGIAILAQPRKHSQIEIARPLWLLAAFALAHALGNFVEALAQVQMAHVQVPYTQDARWDASRLLALGQGLTLGAYVFVFEFGRRLLGLSRKTLPAWSLPALLGLILAGCAVASDPWVMAQILFGHLIRFPAGVLCFVGFLAYRRTHEQRLEPHGVGNYFVAAAVFSLAWGTFCGLVRPGAWLDPESFVAAVHVPVQLLRAGSALGFAAAMIGILRIFHWETVRRMEEALVTRERVTEGLEEDILIIDRGFKVVWANRRARDRYPGIVGDTCHHGTHGLDLPCRPPHDRCPILDLPTDGTATSVLHTHFDRSGAPFFVEVSARPVKDSAGRVLEYVHTAKDVTRSVNLEETIRSISDPLLVLSPRFTVVAANQAVLVLTGYGEAELQGAPAGKVLDATSLRVPGVEDKPRGVYLQDHRTLCRTKAGEEIPVSCACSVVRGPAGNLTGFVVLFRDLRDKERMEEALRQAQKMEAVGRLAGGVAHDFNNLLSVILFSAQEIAQELPEGHPLREDAEQIQKAGKRGAALTRQLLTFSRKSVVQNEVLDPNAVVSSVEKFIRRIIGEDIHLEVQLAPGPWSVFADAGQLEQVLMNLSVNARDAMPGGGRVVIRTANVEAVAGDSAEVPPGRYMCLTVSDTGCGMTPEVRARLFEPFFTTKEPGKGTGLGLATVYGIVQQARGFIYVDSAPGHGSTFRVYVPAVQGSAAPAPVGPAAPSPGGDGQTILVVEDDEALNTMVCRLLAKNGYRTVSAYNGAEAVSMCSAIAGKVRLVLTDVVMPQMSGKELAARAREHCPGTAILFMSGYTDSIIAPHGVLDPGEFLLQKPFTEDELLRKVTEVLSNGKPGIVEQPGTKTVPSASNLSK